MRTGRQFLYLFISISVALAAYLYYVDKDRKQSVEQYLSSPKVGDVYKVKQDDEEGKSWVHQLKVKEVNDSGVVFMASNFKADASADYYLNHYNTASSQVYTHRQLKEIKDGKWNNWQRNNTTIIEIERKK